ncbi:hypothetical protein CK227_10450 [Mesorhizobium sp. WSM4308]|uniref:hypothetical protein n=1 Tax=Mesorhizobium sp. WSM4308 TaxID=2029409 RepID=UPI000BAF93F1|nr:hypothetical protein [Mesorhizobium sp. WSM4308]PBB75203.1 hypothetical protein CK227_10450 [Mesorhizobium sp. WSM4308]
MATRQDYGQPQTGGQGFARTNKTFGRRVNLLAADLVTANVVSAFKVPAGFVVTGIIAVSSDVDTNGTPTVALSVGDAGSSVRYLSSSAIGQAGTSTQTLASTGLLFVNTAETEILVTVTTGSATAAAGTLDLYLNGFML